MRNASRICVSSLHYAKPIFGWMLQIVSPSPAPAALAPLAGERIVSDAPRSDWPAGRFVSPSPARPPSPHWPANELFQTLRAPIGRPTNCFRRSIFGLEQYLKTAIFHTIFTHCWLSIVSDFIRAFCFRVFLLFLNIDHLFQCKRKSTYFTHSDALPVLILKALEA